jgi:outer membrane protein
VDSDIKPTITFEYFVRDNLGIEVLAALPFKHDIAIDGLGTVGSTRHLPPVVSLQYHFNGSGKVSPFVGAGLNYTTFFSEDTRGALAASELKLEDSWGLAAHAGVDFAMGERGALRVDVRWADIDTKVKLDGAGIGTVNLDPLVYGAAYVLKF